MSTHDSLTSGTLGRGGGHPEPASIRIAVRAVMSALATGERFRRTTLANRSARMEWFAGFVEVQGVEDLDSVTPEHVRAFIASRRASGEPPALSEKHSRRAAVRLLYREARTLNLAATDPTLDVELPPRSPTSARPLVDAEVEAGRRYANRKRDLRPGVCWALAEATAWTSEMPHIRTSDFDPREQTVFLHGGATTQARVARLTPWASALLRRRIEEVRQDEERNPVLMGEGRWDDPDEGRAAATMALTSVLRAARLTEPGVNPRSIPAWAGRRALERGSPIHVVARMLGVKSLDQAAGIVGFQWRAGDDR